MELVCLSNIRCCSVFMRIFVILVNILKTVSSPQLNVTHILTVINTAKDCNSVFIDLGSAVCHTWSSYDQTLGISQDSVGGGVSSKMSFLSQIIIFYIFLLITEGTVHENHETKPFYYVDKLIPYLRGPLAMIIFLLLLGLFLILLGVSGVVGACLPIYNWGLVLVSAIKNIFC